VLDSHPELCSERLNFRREVILKTLKFPVIVFLVLFSCGTFCRAANADCASSQLDAHVRKTLRAPGSLFDTYTVSFEVKDTCPDDDDRVHSIHIKFTYKTQGKNGAISEQSSVVVGYVQPRKSHHTVVDATITTSDALGREIVDVYVDSVSVINP
jgi:hypothetical protein